MAAGVTFMLVVQSAMASLTYSRGDMILGFRSAPGDGDLEVNLGSVTQITSILGSGQTLSFTNKFTSSNLAASVGTLNNTSWSVSAAVNAANVISGVARNTLWLTSARGLNSADVNTQTTPWYSGSMVAQGNTVSPVLTIGYNAATYSSSVLASPNNTATAVVVPDGNQLSYHAYIGDQGDFGTAQGNIENTLGASFTTGGMAARSDFYHLTPDSSGTNTTYLGFFELNQAGALSFVSVPESGTFAASLCVGLPVFAFWCAWRKNSRPTATS